MSHFVVMVTNTDEYGVESQLEPFYEQGDESDYFMKREYFLKNNEKEINSWLDSEIESCQKNVDNKEIERAKETGGKPFFWSYKEVPTKEQYINDLPKYVSPFAVLHNEEWIEKGSMGWFGVSDDKYTDEEWGKKFQQLIKSLDPETEVTIVDCHI